MSYRTDKSRVLGLGTAGTGTGHWWAQRLTSVALVPLTILFLFPFARYLGADWETVRAAYSGPWNALVAILFLATTFYHLQQGLQVVVEDYVHNKPVRTGLLVANTFLCAVFGLTGVFAIAKIAFSA